MNAWKKSVFSNKSVAWIVLVAVIMLSLMPVHTHMHHADDAMHNGLELISPHHDVNLTSSHEHLATIHAVTDTAGHSGHEDVTVLSSASDTLIKKINLIPLFLAVFIGFLVLLGTNPVSRNFRRSIELHYRNSHICSGPPLRAPPLS